MSSELVLVNIKSKSREMRLANRVVKPCKGVIPMVVLHGYSRRFLSRSDVVKHLIYNCSKTVGGLRAGLQMKVILPGSFTTWNYLLYGWSGKGTSCGQRFESVRHGGRYLAQDSICDVPQVGVSPV